MLFWKALGVHEDRARSAADWLLGQKGRTLDPGRRPEEDRRPRHDAGRLALGRRDPLVAGADRDGRAGPRPGRAGRPPPGRGRAAADPRPGRGLRGLELRQQVGLRPPPPPPARADGPGPARAGRGRAEDGGRSAAPSRYLVDALPGVRASASLGWGLVGLRAWGEVPGGSEPWLARGFAGSPGAPTPPPSSPACSWPAAAGRSNSSGGAEAETADENNVSGFRHRGHPMSGGRDFRRRTFLTGAGALAATGLGAKAWRDHDERGLRAEVFVARRRVVRRRPRTPDRRRPDGAGALAALGGGQVGAAQAEPRRAEPRGAPRSTPIPRSSAPRPRSSAAGGARGRRRRGAGALPRLRIRPRTVGARAGARRGGARLHRPEPRRRLDRRQPAPVHAAAPAHPAERPAAGRPRGLDAQDEDAPLGRGSRSR